MNWIINMIILGVTSHAVLLEEVASSVNPNLPKLDMIEAVFKRSFEKASHTKSLGGRSIRSAAATRHKKMPQDDLSYLQHGYHPANADTWKLQCIWKSMRNVAKQLPEIVTSSNGPMLRTELQKMCEIHSDTYCSLDFKTSQCDPNQIYRSIDGTCNNLNNTRWGSAVQPFERFLPADYSEGDRFIGPFNNIWRSDQCDHIKYFHGVSSLSDCKQRCQQRENCTAFNYNQVKQGCHLRACPVPIPAPMSKNKYEGYALISDTFSGPFDNVWNDDQCPMIKSFGGDGGFSLSGCQNACLRYSNCTAINFNDVPTICELRACPISAPAPEWDNGYHGYSLTSGTLSGPFDNIWRNDQCKHIKYHHGITSLSVCEDRCSKKRKSPKCNAFNYNEVKQGCHLWACPVPIPAPTSKNKYEGYTLSAGTFSGPFDNVWNDDQCPMIKSLGGDGGFSLSGCQNACLRYSNCTAINFNDVPTICELRACPISAPAPKWDSGYHGYSSSSGGPGLRRSKNGEELPNPRKISRALSNSEPREQPKVSLMLMQWGQFLDHDITLTPERELEDEVDDSTAIMCCNEGRLENSESLWDDCVPIDVSDDPYYQMEGRQCIRFVRSMLASTGCGFSPMEQINRITSFIDGSMIYGSDLVVFDSLRTKSQGLLNTTLHEGNGQPLPPRGSPTGNGPLKCPQAESTDKCFLAGDVRVDEIPGLTAMHTAFIRLHNYIADDLSKLNLHWVSDDERLYQETRRIVIALIQQITYRDWLPHVLGPSLMDDHNLNTGHRGYRDSYDPNVNPSIRNVFATAAFRFGHSLISEVIKAASSAQDLPVPGHFFNISVIESSGTSPSSLLKGLSGCPSQPIDPVVEIAFTNTLFAKELAEDGNFYGLDLVSLNIQRGRDHGIPSYREWRKFCGLEDIRTFEDLKNVMPEEIAETFNSIYHDIDDIDLFPAGLAENSASDGRTRGGRTRDGILGPTFSCIIARQFANIKHGDRFWYEREGQPKPFTPEQLTSIRSQSLSSILCRVSEHTIYDFQPDAFLVEDNKKNKAKSCSSYKFINLQPWKEN